MPFGVWCHKDQIYRLKLAAQKIQIRKCVMNWEQTGLLQHYGLKTSS